MRPVAKAGALLADVTKFEDTTTNGEGILAYDAETANGACAECISG